MFILIAITVVLTVAVFALATYAFRDTLLCALLGQSYHHKLVRQEYTERLVQDYQTRLAHGHTWTYDGFQHYVDAFLPPQLLERPAHAEPIPDYREVVVAQITAQVWDGLRHYNQPAPTSRLQV